MTLMGPKNLLARVPLAWQHRSDVLSVHQRQKINRFIRLAIRQGGLRCHGGYVVPCCYCAFWFPLSRLTFEHLTNRRDGGTNAQANLALACYRCNNGRCRRELEAFRKYGLEKWQRRRLRHFRMDVSGPQHVEVFVRGASLRLRKIRWEGPR